MKSIVIYDSAYGNTREVAEAISGGLKETGIEVDTFYVKDIKKLKAADYDLMVLGSPTKWGTMSFTTRRFIGGLKNKEWANKPFAAFDTQNPENIDQGETCASEKIAEKLGERQMTQVVPVLKSIVIGWKGPMQEGEIERAREYAREIGNKIAR